MAWNRYRSDEERRRETPLFRGVSVETRSFESGERPSGEQRARNRRRAGFVAKAVGVFFLALMIWGAAILVIPLF